ncbi:hypothetical protein LXT21_20930 [Myxococcus sp. K38C18041901]|uniref:hypothetical protein n=1 Tax=Myxococcus guangdongensis TaxID=2906760 RepID=UPI0020A6E4BC|nr:hypothetical protein [Myxococcus guangdongensis]MCP3061248.1 hypothetical protein [Myxococcus guangdongensis]
MPSHATPEPFVAVQVVAVTGQLTDPVAQAAVHADNASDEESSASPSSTTSAAAPPHPAMSATVQANSHSFKLFMANPLS